MSRINRVAQIGRFLRVALLLLWTIWVIYRERRRVIQARQSGDHSARPNIEVLIKVLVAYRKTALKLGVLLIKLGQFLSSRADLLPDEALEVLSDLQDEVPPAPFTHVVSVIEKELGRPLGDIFSSIEEKCTAAASLGQVHKAVLKSTGETVAVKVQRPHVDELVRMDLSTLKFVIWVINRVSKTREFIDLNGLYEEFSRTTYEEIDYLLEADNARRFTEMFENDPTVYIPKIHNAYCSRRLLVLQWIDGIKVNNHAALEAAGIDRGEAAVHLVEAYFHQFFLAGFFHADPHPGNIFIQKGDEFGPRVCLIDFGMVGTLTDPMQKVLKDLFSSYLMRDAHALVGALSRLGFIGRKADLEPIERAAAMVLDRYYGMSLKEARQARFGDVARDIEDLLYGQPFQVPTRFAFTGKAIGTLVGVSTGLAPDFDFVAVATPYARQFLGLGEDQKNQILQQVLSQAAEIGMVLLRLPKLLERVTTKLESGQLQFKVGEGGGKGAKKETGTSTGLGGLAWALIVGSEMAGGTVLMLFQQSTAGWFCLGLAGITAISLVWRTV